jgi:hypothetical protein
MPTRPKEFNRGNIYLSGGMSFAKDLGADWRVEASNKLKEMKYFPLDITELDVAYNKNHGKLTLPTSNDDPIKFKSYMRKHFIDTDLKLIEQHTDALIVYYDESARRGAGTVSEAQYAYNLKMPIFLVAEYPSIEELHKNVSGWLVALTTNYFTNFSDLYKYLNDLPEGILKKDRYGNHGVDGKYLCHLTGKVFDKKKTKFVSEINPLYSQEAVSKVVEVHESYQDRYDFFLNYLTDKTGDNFK